MKHINQLFFSLLFALAFSTISSAQLTTPTGSQVAVVKQRVGITDITINYSRPRVNDRAIWGKLVPYGMNNLGFGTAKESPWRAGANQNTTIEFSHEVSIGGTKVAAGIYGLHMTVMEDGSVDIILSSNSSSWGSYFYDPKEDVVKTSVQSTEVSHREFLTYEFIEVSPNSAVAALTWEKKQIPFKIEVNTPEIVMASMRNELRTQPGFTAQNWQTAANFAMNNGELEQALIWADVAISAPFVGQKNFGTLQTKAQVLSAMGKTADADKIMKEALPLGTVFQAHQYGRTLIGAGRSKKALEVLKWNAANHKNTWPVNYGLGRAYSAAGNYKTALKYLNKALKNAPDQGNKDQLAINIEKLKNNKDIN